MLRYFALGLIATAVISSPPAWAESPSYHLQRLQIQARAFLDTMPPLPSTADLAVPLDQQLAQSTSNSLWSQQMVREDVDKILKTSDELNAQMGQGMTADDLLAAKATMESLARRLRVSSAALNLSGQSKTQLDFLMLELDESSLAMDAERQQLIAQDKAQRARTSIGVGFGYGYGYGYGGYGGYGMWAPYGWGSYYPYGNINGPGFYGGFPGAYGYGPRGCR